MEFVFVTKDIQVIQSIIKAIDTVPLAVILLCVIRYYVHAVKQHLDENHDTNQFHP